MAARTYPTGNSRTFQYSATLELHYAGAVYTSDGGTPPFESGWMGDGLFHPYMGIPGPTQIGGEQYHLITGQLLLATCTIRTGTVDTGFGLLVWRTEVFLDCGSQHYHTQWDNVVKGTITEAFTVTMACEEYAVERDSELDGWAGDGSLILQWKPVAITASIAGDASHTLTLVEADEEMAGSFAFRPFYAQGYFIPFFHAENDEPYLPGEYDAYYMTLPVTGLGDLPGTDVVYAEVSGVVCTPIDDFLTWEKHHAFEPHELISHVGGYKFTSRDGSTGPWPVTLQGIPSFTNVVHGDARSWTTPITDLPVTFDGPVRVAGPATSFSETYIFSSTQLVVNPLVDPIADVPGSLGVDETEIALLQWGDAWEALTLDRASSLPLEDFSRIGTYRTAGVETPGDGYGWSAAEGIQDGPAYTDGYMTATATGSGPHFLIRTLKSDWEDMLLSPSAWWTAHGALTDADTQAFWANTGNPGSSPHVGDWFRIGKRLLPTSDITNWSSYRYLEVTGKAFADCTVTFYVTWYAYQIDTDGGTVQRRAVRREPYTLDLTTSDTTFRLDLARQIGTTDVDGGMTFDSPMHNTLRHVHDVQIELPDGATVFFSSMGLVSDASPVVDVLQADGPLLSALADGKHALMCDENNRAAWGWPLTHNVWVNDGGWVSSLGAMTIDELAAELNMQEGWTATVENAPDNGTPNLACYLLDTWDASLPHTFTARRTYGRIDNYPVDDLNEFTLTVNVGYGVKVLTFDPDTQRAAAAKIEALTYEGDGVTVKKVWDSDRTDAHGIGHLETTPERNQIYIVASRGTAKEHSDSQYENRKTWHLVTLDGQDNLTTYGRLLDYATDRWGTNWLTYAKSSSVDQIRSLDMEATNPSTSILALGLGSPSRLIRNDHHHLLAAIDTGAVKLWTSPDSVSYSLASTIDSAHTYTGTVLREDPAGTYHNWMTTDAGAVYRRTSRDGGDTWDSLETVSTLPTMASTGPDVRYHGNEWFAACPLASGSLKLYSSKDGDSWAEETEIADAGTSPVLLPLEGRSLIAVYHDGSGWVSSRVEDTGSWNVGSAVAVVTVDNNGAAAFLNPQKAVVAFADGSEALDWRRTFEQGDSWVTGSEG